MAWLEVSALTVLVFLPSGVYWLMTAPQKTRHKPTEESRLREEFMHGDMEVEEFEERLDAVLHHKRLPK